MGTWAREMQRAWRMAAILGAAVACAAPAPPARASIYKCQGEHGAVVYQEYPCPVGRQLRNFDEDPPDLSVIPGATGNAARPPQKPRDTRTLNGDVSIGKVDGDASARKFIQKGMSEAEVLARIGRPDATAGGSRTHQTHWSYLPAPGDPDTVTSITFAGGVVSEVTRKVVKK